MVNTLLLFAQPLAPFAVQTAYNVSLEEAVASVRRAAISNLLSFAVPALSNAQPVRQASVRAIASSDCKFSFAVASAISYFTTSCAVTLKNTDLSVFLS